MATLKIQGATYTVVTRESLDDVIAAGHVNTAANMKRNGQVARLTMRRSNGKNIYQVMEFEGGRQVTKPLAIGEW